MNVYRLIADMSHLFAILFLLSKICKTRSCKGISGKSQLLFLLVFLTRYLDLFTQFVSYYNSFMKIMFISCTTLTVLLIFVLFKSTYDRENDTFQIALLLLPAAGLAFYVNYDFSFLEVMWTFSIYLEAVAILPQFFMIRKTGNMEMFTYHYLFALGLYRAFYIFNWVYRYTYEFGYFDSISFWSGCVQTATYCYLLYTKEFLKWQARAYFRLYNQEKDVAEMEKGGKIMMQAQATGSEPEQSPCPSVEQSGGSTVSGQEGDDSVNQSTQQPIHAGTANMVAQTPGGVNPGSSDDLSAATAAAAAAAGRDPDVEEDIRNSCTTGLLQSQAQ